MPAGINDKFSKTFNSVNPNVATVTSTRTALATTLACDNLAGWPTDTVVHFSTYQIDVSNNVVNGTQIDWAGIVSGNNIGTLTRLAGASDSGNAIGDIVEMNPTASWANRLAEGILVEHNQDGTHSSISVTGNIDVNDSSTSLRDSSDNELLKFTKTASAVNEVTVTNAATGNAPRLSASGGDTNIDLNLRGKGTGAVKHGSGSISPFPFDYIASGCVWSGDSYGSTRNASMTSGVIVINGNPVTAAAVSARSFTASKDTYVDASDNGDGTALLTYTEVNNNAASPALAANSVRIAIIVTGASNIANVGSINQGEFDKVLPIASSTAYSVCDSLGNLICPRDPSRQLLGFRQITSNFNTTSGGGVYVQITGLSVPVIVPTGRKIKITMQTTSNGNNTGGAVNVVGIFDGTIGGGGTQIAQMNTGVNTGTSNVGAVVVAHQSPAGSKTYNGGLTVTGGTGTFAASATGPAWIKVELV